jgi:very-long-chain (3R)-3-hydroxyacyl-CoA dehydratase
MGVVKVYLCVYNWLLFAGWLQILVSAVKALQQSGPSGVYAAVEKPLQIWQTAALLEIFNSIVGIVRSPVMATLPQIGSRIYLTWGILFSFPQVQEHWLVTSLVLSWSITEVIRYSFFALKETFGYTPRFLLWLRYTTFFVMYPTGICSEAGLVFVTLPFMQLSDLYCLRMPNKLNFGFDYYYMSIVALLAYIPGSPGMYTHMIRQRKKALGSKPKAS